jgi:hypothetical protein
VARKRAPGGGRKRSPDTPRAQLTIRIPENLRGELESAAKKRGRKLTREVIWRLQVSLNRERIDRQDQVMRALCFLFTDVAEKLRLHEGLYFREGRKWHRDPFTFRAFKLAVGKLLDALEPSGEAKSPFVKLENSDEPLHQQLVEWFKTPDSAATHAATLTLESLFRPKKITAEDRAAIEQLESEILDYGSGDLMIENFEREYFAMDTVGRVLGIPQQPKIGIFAKSKKGD